MSTELLAMRPEAGELLLKELLTYNYGLVLGIFTLTFAFYIALAKLEIIEFLEQKKFLKYPLWRWFLFVSLIGNLSWVWASLALYKAQIIIVSGEKSWNCPIVLINAWFNDCGTGTYASSLSVLAKVLAGAISVNYIIFVIVILAVFGFKEDKPN